MGKAVNTLKVPVTKGSNGVIVFNEETDWLYKENPCIRCNKCVEACPMRLMPMEIDQYIVQVIIKNVKIYWQRLVSIAVLAPLSVLRNGL